MLVVFAGFSAVVMLLWNALMPAIFALTAVTFWQAAGLLLLARILIGGFGGRHFGHGHHRHGGKIREKWMTMTPEQRREFMKSHHMGHHGRFGGDCCGSAPEENRTNDTQGE